MSHRNLTSPSINGPYPHGEDDQYSHEESENPFVSPVDDSSLEASPMSGDRSSEDGSQYGRPFNAYNGYYSQNGTSSNLLSNENSSSDDVHQRYLSPNIADESSSNINSPPEYDRYPSMAGSRVVSSTSLTSQFYQQQKSEQESITASSKSGNPFMSADFSPFGGYPASSFPLHIDEKEPDDYLHNPDPITDAVYDKHRFLYDLKNIDKRSLGGLLGVVSLFIIAAAIFIVLPVLTYSGVTEPYHPESYEILTQYHYPILSAIRMDLVDPDTPRDARTIRSQTGDDWELVFSDEFNVEGRTFYEGDDQFFTAVDLNYAVTQDLEWYDPDAVTTIDGSLNLRMDAYKSHDLYYRSGMVQSWNQMCFTQGKIEVSCRLPNYGNVTGLWPGLWSMGNLGRPGYAASTDGVWPYTYDSCDAGITANQSSPDGISYLPGQRLNKCTCDGEEHPNPGTGRGAPEIDILEGEVDTSIGVGIASQSMQIAPFDIWYYPDYNFISIYNQSVTAVNAYTGGPFQQAVSGTTTLNINWYEMGEGDHAFQRYAFEYLNHNDDGYVTWFVGEDPTLTIQAYALGPNGNIDWRRISKEPMALILNLGISNNWAYIDWAMLHFPVNMRLDYVRLYQPSDEINVGCDPEDYPTYDYIQDHLNVYSNMNLTSWTDSGYTVPRNSLVHQC